MRYNNLVDIGSPTASDNALPAVLELDLTGNEFSHVPSGALGSLPALRRLILRDNRIHYVGASAFAASAFLEYVDLGANRFNRSSDGGGPLTLDSRAFCGLEPRALTRSPGVTDWTGLKHVRLDHNALTQPKLCSLVAVWTLVDVDLAGNPLRCDCPLLGALRRLSDTAVALRVNHIAQCASPDRLAGKTVGDVLRQRTTCVEACDRVPCAVPRSLATSSSSSLSSVTESAVTPCVSAFALACAFLRIVAYTQPGPRRICTCRTARPTTDRS